MPRNYRGICISLHGNCKEVVITFLICCFEDQRMSKLRDSLPCIRTLITSGDLWLWYFYDICIKVGRGHFFIKVGRRTAVSSIYRLFPYTWSRLICFYFLKKKKKNITWFNFFKKKIFFSSLCVCVCVCVFLFLFFFKSSMDSFLEYISDSIYVFKVVDFIFFFFFFGLRKLV